MGMSVSIFSYRGEVTIGLMVDAALVPAPNHIVMQLEREVAALAEIPARSEHSGSSRRHRNADAGIKETSHA
jgi:hypothetical protein